MEKEPIAGHRQNAPYCAKCGHPDGHCDFDADGNEYIGQCEDCGQLYTNELHGEQDGSCPGPKKN